MIVTENVLRDEETDTVNKLNSNFRIQKTGDKTIKLSTDVNFTKAGKVEWTDHLQSECTKF